jgi:hypothetical protein
VVRIEKRKRRGENFRNRWNEETRRTMSVSPASQSTPFWYYILGVAAVLFVFALLVWFTTRQSPAKANDSKSQSVVTYKS